MHRCYRLYRFQFKYNTSSHENVDSIPAFKFNPLINNRDRYLPAELKLSDAQFMSQTLLRKLIQASPVQEVYELRSRRRLFRG